MLYDTSSKYTLSLVVFTALFILQACATAPYSGRSQLMLVSPQQEASLGEQAAQEVLRSERVLRSGPQTQTVQQIGQRLAQASRAQGYQWEFYVIDDPQQVNAFALPGGKIFVYTGLLNAVNQEQLAAVLAHEMAHVLARHGSERLSTLLLAEVGQQAALAALGDMSPTAMQAVSTAFGLGAQYGVILPFSREQEYEADYIGLLIMAQAGYDPQAAVDFWRMMTQRGGGIPEYLSTHPSDENRIAALQQHMAEAMTYYQPAATTPGAPARQNRQGYAPSQKTPARPPAGVRGPGRPAPPRGARGPAGQGTPGPPGTPGRGPGYRSW